MKNHYNTLGLERDAKQEQIKEAYHKLALECHPDKNMNNRTQAIIQFQEISEAYNTLSKQESKKIYDYSLDRKEIIRNVTKKQQEQEMELYNQLSKEFNLTGTYLTKDEQDTINKFMNRMEKQSKRIRKRQ
ncbi:unnamed protein product (macronuclear) [Paramecium tetraurelia]|uniref:J domain-containing protein n=1 Tax=Paramecium tetraurelia TaxID=5888 RepID=A0E483_PARTE|nr:uncharacterized protein GSPATT00023274001 [Paramecium tetraurelia]CAK90100.1 unnamed protein product [Paramecium tetraurelia]|eukprot:XP_001457497.1 hypothetical protein (macronuclear) [Paramecium tetraurelia strain d4-2]